MKKETWLSAKDFFKTSSLFTPRKPKRVDWRIGKTTNDKVDRKIKAKRNELKMEMFLKSRNALKLNFLSATDYISQKLLSKKAITMEKDFKLFCKKFQEESKSMLINYSDNMYSRNLMSPLTTYNANKDKKIPLKIEPLRINSSLKKKKRLSVNLPSFNFQYKNKSPENRRKTLSAKTNKNTFNYKNIQILKKNFAPRLESFSDSNEYAPDYKEIVNKEKAKEIIKQNDQILKKMKYKGIELKPSYLFLKVKKESKYISNRGISDSIKEDKSMSLNESFKSLNSFMTPTKSSFLKNLEHSLDSRSKSVKSVTTILGTPKEKEGFKKRLESIIKNLSLFNQEIKKEDSIHIKRIKDSGKQLDYENEKFEVPKVSFRISEHQEKEELKLLFPVVDKFKLSSIEDTIKKGKIMRFMKDKNKNKFKV